MLERRRKLDVVESLFAYAIRPCTLDMYIS